MVHNADRRICRATGKEYLADLLDVLHALLALGIVERDNEISFRRRLGTILDEFPRRQQVAETDDGKVVHERCAQDRSRRIDRRDAGDDAAELGTIARFALQEKFQDESRHAVDTGITARNDDGISSLRRRFHRHAAAVDLLHHARADDLALTDEVFDELDVRRISCDDCRFLNRPLRTRRHILQTSGTDAHHCYFSHTSATVTFSNLVLARASRPAGTLASAAASATLPMPIFFLTKGDSESP